MENVGYNEPSPYLPGRARKEWFMHDHSSDEMELLKQLMVGALSGFGDAVALDKVTPEKAAHKALVMVESAIEEIQGRGNLGMLGDQKANVFEKPER